MKIHGKKIEGVNVEIIPIPRPDGDIIFKAEGVKDFTAFEKMCPEPMPPMKIVKGGRKEYNLEDPAYKAQVQIHSEKKIAWMVLESLKATDGLEWETVNLGDHHTWTEWSKELRDSGLSVIEVQRIQTGVFTANCLNEAKLEEARKNFLQGQEANEKSTGQNTEQPST